MNEAQTIPAATLTDRDSDGRLVGVAIDGGQFLAASGNNTWLVAIDGSEHSLRAATQAGHLAGQMNNCAIHLINVQPWLSKEAAENELPRLGWEATAEARGLLDRGGVPWRLHVLMGDAVERIVAQAQRLGCAYIVIGSKGLGATEALLLGSVAYKVIHLSAMSVLVVR